MTAPVSRNVIADWLGVAIDPAKPEMERQLAANAVFGAYQDLLKRLREAESKRWTVYQGEAKP